MNVDEEDVVVLVDQLDGFVRLAVFIDFDQSVEAPDTVIDVHDVIARTQLVQFGNRHLLIATDFTVDAITLITVEQLMVGIETKFQIMVDEPLMQGRRNGPHNRLSASDLMEDIFQTLDLSLVLGENVGFVSAQSVADHIVGQHLEILIKGWLRSCRKRNSLRRRSLGQVVLNRKSRLSARSVNKPLRLVNKVSISSGCSMSASVLRRTSFTRRNTWSMS